MNVKTVIIQRVTIILHKLESAQVCKTSGPGTAKSIKGNPPGDNGRCHEWLVFKGTSFVSMFSVFASLYSEWLSWNNMQVRNLELLTCNGSLHISILTTWWSDWSYEEEVDNNLKENYLLIFKISKLLKTKKMLDLAHLLVLICLQWQASDLYEN